MSQHVPKFTFVVASVDRDKQLRSCLESIENAHSYKRDVPIEIIVVFQKNKQEFGFKPRFPEILTFYYIDRLGLSVARNFAIEKSSGEYLIFLDDDASVKEDFIQALIKNIGLHKSLNAFCGRLIDPVSQAPFSRLFYNNQKKNLHRLDYQYFMGSAHVLSRKIIDKVGRYDENFGVGSKYFGSEETDIFFRIKAAKEKVLYLPELVFFHPIPASPDVYVYKYAFALAAMLTKNSINDKLNFPVYCLVALERIAKSAVRIIQNKALRGKYEEKDRVYHYSSVLKGTFDGVKKYVQEEL